ncbi:glutamine synthetase [Penicillium verhagenii]|nr:glutamine synthetase [Penicillium verhagenii]
MKNPTYAITILEKFRAEHPEVSYIRFQWQDYSGVLRARVLIFESVIAQVADGKSIQAAGIALDCTVDNHILPRDPPRGMHWAVPDWSSLRLASHSGTAMVMCALNFTVLDRPLSSDLCPRQTLSRVLGEARQTWEIDFLVGFEVEFVVMKMDESSNSMVRCSDGLGHFAVSGLRDPSYQCVEQCVTRLRAQGALIQAVHTEGFRGQYEIVLGPLPPMQAVDQLILVHDYLKDTFARHGYQVTMSPKPVASETQANGQHMHLSIQPTTPTRLPALWAFCLPLETSYERRKPRLAGDSVGWGTQSRVVPIRKVEPGHWELRCIDVTANMYSTLAAVLGAGLLGLAGNEPLTWPDLGIPANQASYCGEPLPRNLKESLSVLEADDGLLSSMIGRSMIDHYIELKHYEIAQMKNMDAKAIRELLIELF